MGRHDTISEGGTLARRPGARFVLREATRTEHDQVDAAFGGHDLSSLDGYGRFLVAQSGAFTAVERALEAAGVADVIPDWSERRRGDLLLADLADLGLMQARAEDAPELSGEPEVLGAAYVLEGSRLGGAVLGRRLPARAPHRFLLGEGSGPRWRALTELIDARLTEPGEIHLAVRAARAVFACFHHAALRSAPV